MFCSICKKYKHPSFLLCKNLYCSNHAKLLYNISVLTIQKIYRGHKVRRILKKIYFKLPRDLQVYILNFNCITTNKTRENDCSKIRSTIALATHKINDLHNLSVNKITLTEVNKILKILIKYKNYITNNWFNYYKYYFSNIYSLLLILSEVQELPYTFAFLVSHINNDIYESLDLTSNLLNNDFKERAKELLQNIPLFLK